MASQENDESKKDSLKHLQECLVASCGPDAEQTDASELDFDNPKPSASGAWNRYALTERGVHSQCPVGDLYSSMAMTFACLPEAHPPIRSKVHVGGSTSWVVMYTLDSEVSALDMLENKAFRSGPLRELYFTDEMVDGARAKILQEYVDALDEQSKNRCVFLRGFWKSEAGEITLGTSDVFFVSRS
ncbi:hypothetical protein OQA88_8707 [Cercophora sp. LCS_1]